MWKMTAALAFLLCILSMPSAAQTYKLKQSMSVSGQTISSTVYVKGSRKRTESSGIMGMGGNVADIEQCDLKRTVKVADDKKMYFVEPFQVDSGTAANVPTTSAPAGKAQKGGTVTITSSIVDTGERKQMFGLTARHLKTTMTMKSSPDACDDQDITIESDGWYVDLPAFNCQISTPRNPYAGMNAPKRGCTDRTIVRSTGSGKLGFPLAYTQTMKMGGADADGMPAISQSLETIEFTKAPLDDALFDIPAGYREASSASDLYGRPSMGMIFGGGGSGSAGSSPSSPAPTQGTRPAASNGGWSKIPGATSAGSSPSTVRSANTIRIGVLVPANRTSESVSAEELQRFLASQLTRGSIEAVTVSSEADARAAGCVFLLSTDISRLKRSTAGKIGGMFGKITNTGAGGAFDTEVDFRLVSLKTGETTLASKASAKTETEADRAARGVLADEAAAVLAKVQN